MEARELRQTNWVSYYGKDYQVSSINSDETIRLYEDETNTNTVGCYSLKSEGFRPIQLSEEWLLKLGFVKSKTFIGIEFVSGMFLCYRDGKIVLEATTLFPILRFDGCKHVHQLQNLYFALTGQELNTHQLTSRRWLF